MTHIRSAWWVTVVVRLRPQDEPNVQVQAGVGQPDLNLIFGHILGLGFRIAIDAGGNQRERDAFAVVNGGDR